MGIKLRPDEADLLHESALSWGWRDMPISPNSSWERFRIATREMEIQSQSVIGYNTGKGNKVTLTGDGHEELFTAFRKSLG